MMMRSLADASPSCTTNLLLKAFSIQFVSDMFLYLFTALFSPGTRFCSSEVDTVPSLSRRFSKDVAWFFSTFLAWGFECSLSVSRVSFSCSWPTVAGQLV